MATVLITSTDLEWATRLRSAFEPEDRVEFVADVRDARRMLGNIGEEEDAAVILTGPAAEGLDEEMLQAARDGRRFPVVAVADDTTSVPADADLDDVFADPIDADEVALIVRRLIERKRLQDELGIVGRSEAIQEVLERVAQIAPVGSTVLITGESGTGKELVARGLHRRSPRRGKPFIAVNIAALSETLLESELFGHEKGAFTGASSLRKGMFELADGGTIFLDEIAEMPLHTQTKLLRVLEQREFMRVGGGVAIEVDVRVIAATNRNLRQAVAVGDFRRDLYYRLDVLHIHMPPLRERREDIPLLVREFIQEFSREHDRHFKGITPEAMEILVDYEWPGNVRELRNLVESMVVLAPGSVIRPEDIPPDVRGGSGRAMLPTRVPSRPPAAEGVAQDEAGGRPSPEMEFVFRTLVELKLDVEDIRREFEEYKRRHPELLRAAERALGRGRSLESLAVPGAEFTDREVKPGEIAEPGGEAADEDEDLSIRFEPGMTMEELERAAIEATLRAVDGNRRRASEQLGIGERTLYRKLKEYEIEA